MKKFPRKQDFFPADRIKRFTKDETWLKARGAKIQGSDMRVLCHQGFADESLFGVWSEKRAYLRGEIPPRAPTPHRLIIGRYVEPGILCAYEEIFDRKVIEAGNRTIWCHKTEDWLGCTLDALQEHPEHGWGPVEVKNVSPENVKEWKHANRAPLRPWVQLQHQLMCTGFSGGWIVANLANDESKE